MPNMKSSTTVMRAETSSEPRQPSLLEKKKNMAGTGQASVVDQRANQREQGLVFRSVAARPKELSDLGQGRLSA